MKNSKSYIYILSCTTLVLAITILLIKSYMLISDSDPYKELVHIYGQETFDIKGNYYVYFYKNDCKYCDNVKDEIFKFAKRNELYVFNTDENMNYKTYDWDNHYELWAVEIGEGIDEEHISYYKKYEDKVESHFPKTKYFYQFADKNFVENYSNKTVGKMYAILKKPVIDYSKASALNLIVPAVPILIEIKEGKIVNYYFDDYEILNFLGSSKDPIDSL